MTERSHRTIGLNSLGFVLVALAGYLSAMVTLGYVLKTISLPRASTLIGIAVSYVVIGVYGYTWARNSASLRSALAYFAIQITLAVILIVLAKAPALLLVMLPLAGQSVVLLTRGWMLAVCAVMLLVLAVPMALFAGWGAAIVLGMFLLAGIVFVVVITRLAVNEQRARAEVERLLAELKRANDRLREYAAQAEELATTKERNRLAREIHDSLGHYLTVVIVQIEAATALMETNRAQSLEGLHKARALAQAGLAEVRHSVAALRSSPANGSLVDSLATLLDECSVTGISTEFQLTGAPRRLSPAAELTLYRAAQEGLTNVRKHAQAERANVTLDYSADNVLLVVHDNGIGATRAEKGFGLVGVHERVKLLGGEVRITTAAGEGFTLEIGIPG